jgi:hypothetical protein
MMNGGRMVWSGSEFVGFIGHTVSSMSLEVTMLFLLLCRKLPTEFVSSGVFFNNLLASGVFHQLVVKNPKILE